MVKANISENLKLDSPFKYVEDETGTNRIYGNTDFFTANSLKKYYYQIINRLLSDSLETALLSIQDKIRGINIENVIVNKA